MDDHTPRPRRGRRLVIAAAVVLAALVLWEAGLKERFIPKNFGVVVPGEIYRSGRLTPSALKRVAREHDIRTVIDFGAYDEGTSAWSRIRETDEKLGLDRVTLPMFGDGTGDPENYAAALRILADASTHPVLVQCAAGAQRTGMCIVLYRTVIEDMPVGDAYRETHGYGHSADDNWAFLYYLGRNLDRIETAYHADPAPPAPGQDEAAAETSDGTAAGDAAEAGESGAGAGGGGELAEH